MPLCVIAWNSAWRRRAPVKTPEVVRRASSADVVPTRGTQAASPRPCQGRAASGARPRTRASRFGAPRSDDPAPVDRGPAGATSGLSRGAIDVARRRAGDAASGSAPALRSSAQPGGGDARFPADLCDARGTGRCHRCAAPDRLRVPPRCGDRGTGACSVTDGEGGRVAIEVVLRERGPATDDQMQRPITDVRSDIRGRGEVAIREPGVLRVDRLELLARLARSRGMRERSTGRSSAGTCRPPERTGGRRSVCAGPGGGAVGVVTGPRPRQARGSAARPSGHGAGSRPG